MNPKEKDNQGYVHKNFSSREHRQVAYNQIYLKNRGKYPLPFSQYFVHHKNGIKDDNRVSNLEIVTPEEHEIIHNRLVQDYAKCKRLLKIINVAFILTLLVCVAGLIVSLTICRGG